MNLKIRLIPDDFVAPKKVLLGDFHLRPLGVADLEDDYEAVSSNAAFLADQHIFGPENTWPMGVTRADNLADLGWHEVEFRLNSSFAYRVNTREGHYLGCVYIYPTAKVGFDAEVYFWLTETAAAEGGLEMLGKAVQNWISEAWPFAAVLYPGREQSWDAFEALESMEAKSVVQHHFLQEAAQ